MPGACRPVRRADLPVRGGCVRQLADFYEHIADSRDSSCSLRARTSWPGPPAPEPTRPRPARNATPPQPCACTVGEPPPARPVSPPQLEPPSATADEQPELLLTPSPVDRAVSQVEIRSLVLARYSEWRAQQAGVAGGALGTGPAAAPADLGAGATCAVEVAQLTVRPKAELLRYGSEVAWEPGCASPLQSCSSPPRSVDSRSDSVDFTATTDSGYASSSELRTRFCQYRASHNSAVSPVAGCWAPATYHPSGTLSHSTTDDGSEPVTGYGYGDPEDFMAVMLDTRTVPPAAVYPTWPVGHQALMSPVLPAPAACGYLAGLPAGYGQYPAAYGLPTSPAFGSQGVAIEPLPNMWCYEAAPECVKPARVATEAGAAGPRDRAAKAAAQGGRAAAGDKVSCSRACGLPLLLHTRRGRASRAGAPGEGTPECRQPGRRQSQGRMRCLLGLLTTCHRQQQEQQHEA